MISKYKSNDTDYLKPIKMNDNHRNGQSINANNDRVTYTAWKCKPITAHAAKRQMQRIAHKQEKKNW